MEPRINSLISPTLLERRSNGVPSFQLALPRPAHAENSHATDELQATTPVTKEHLARESAHSPIVIDLSKESDRAHPLQPQEPEADLPHLYPSSSRIVTSKAAGAKPKKAVPLDQVLNEVHDAEAPASREAALNNLLINTPRKRRRVDDRCSFLADSASNGVDVGHLSTNSGHLTLPKPLAQSVKRKATSRLPPLLQGLHQPPPDAGIFPRITEKEETVRRLGISSIVPGTTEEPTRGTRAVPELSSSSNSGITSSGDVSQVKGAKLGKPISSKAKRNKWSDSETADLLRGVAKFGIGNWKKILECEEFSFTNRTAVDLKDRFRTCRPTDYRKDKSTGPCQEVRAHASSLPEQDLQESIISSRRKKKSRSGTHRKDENDLARLGIAEPFAKGERRERRPFTEDEDKDLLQGYLSHGSQWHLICKDKTLHLSSRQPRDLRDRFRNKYPDRYKDAGLKGKPERSGIPGQSETNDVNSQKISDAAENTEEPDAPLAEKERRPVHLSGLPTLLPSSRHDLTDPNGHRPLTSVITQFSDLYMPPSFPAESGDDYSPITLSRQILGWADINAPMSTLTAPYASTVHDHMLSIPAQTTTATSYTTGITMSMLVATDPAAPPPPLQTAAMAPQASTPTTYASARHGVSHPLPSLSALTLPSAPNSRGPALALPGPSDLLSGYNVDYDSRTDNHAMGILWDEGLP